MSRFVRPALWTFGGSPWAGSGTAARVAYRWAGNGWASFASAKGCGCGCGCGCGEILAVDPKFPTALCHNLTPPS
jgi:hypothetical protein